MDFSELWPNVGSVADEICMIRSMYVDIPNHEPTTTLFNTGSNVMGRPSIRQEGDRQSGEPRGQARTPKC
jgi:hypothetical protein